MLLVDGVARAVLMVLGLSVRLDPSIARASAPMAAVMVLGGPGSIFSAVHPIRGAALRAIAIVATVVPVVLCFRRRSDFHPDSENAIHWVDLALPFVAITLLDMFFLVLTLLAFSLSDL